MDQHTLILVVDDDPDLRKLIGDFLQGHGYRVQVAENAAAMRQKIERQRPDLVILDVMMPGEDGLSAARRLITENGPPVIMLSALGSDTDRIIGLEVGADDYLPKPCNPRELMARVRAVLRRRSAAEPVQAATARFEFAGWRLDLVRRELRDPAGTFINLSDGEFALLRTFVDIRSAYCRVTSCWTSRAATTSRCTTGPSTARSAGCVASSTNAPTRR